MEISNGDSKYQLKITDMMELSPTVKKQNTNLFNFAEATQQSF